jgi:undecaprenyl pyrophosphate phosphatase UppP
VFTGIPAPKPPIEVNADTIMRNVVLKNQVVLGTVKWLLRYVQTHTFNAFGYYRIGIGLALMLMILN